MTTADTPWPRAIILMDMNAFFASVEQLDHPEWQGRPIAITNGRRGSTIITCSYEARAWGIKTGMRLKEARRHCPELIQAPSRPRRYVRVSTAIMQALQAFTPDIEIFSVDEAFLDITRCQLLLGSPAVIARQVKQTVLQTSGILCSVGVSGDKTTAKYAAKLHKPDGLTIIPPWEAEEALRNAPVTALCGVNKGIGGYLQQHGVTYCGEMKNIPVSVLARRFGNPGRRIWLMAQGKDPEAVITEIAAPKSMGHGKVIPPDTSERSVLLTYYRHMSEKVGYRLRKHHLRAQSFYIGLRTGQQWLKSRARVAEPTDDGEIIYIQCIAFLNHHWHGEGCFQVQVTALDPQPAQQQQSLFTVDNGKREEVNRVMDAINERYGEYTLTPVRLLERSDMPNVIAPAWKPNGHRQTI
ncbi:MAG: DNA polymerase IV [Pseudomonadota bacterium]|nr:DNA polymerase IV [Pseudomonadota bacterium]